MIKYEQPNRINSPDSHSFLLFFLLGYLAFIPLGPIPIHVVGELRLDVLFGAIIALFLCFHCNKIRRYPIFLTIFWVFYFVIIFLSTILSVDIAISLRNSLVTLGYSVITFIAPLVFVTCANRLRRWFFFLGVVVSVSIIYLYLFLGYTGYHHSNRFAFGGSVSDPTLTADLTRVDPNMTAAGLLLTLIVYFPVFFNTRKFNLFEILGACSIFFASTLTFSRSAITGFVISVCLSFLIVFCNPLNFKRSLLMKRRVLITIVLILTSILAFFFLEYAFFSDIVERFSTRLIYIANDYVRIELLLDGWSTFIYDFKTIVIGAGFMTTNPHNEYLRVLSTMGLLGVAGAICFLSSMFYYCVHVWIGNNRMMFSALSIIIYILVISLWYGYTKLPWVAWMFLLLLYREACSCHKST